MQAEIKHIKEKYATSEDICDLKLEVELLKSSSTSLNHSKKLEGNKQKVPDSCGGRSAEYSVAAAISAEDKAVRTVTHHTPERSGQASKSLHTDAGNKINNAFRETFSHVLQNENKTQNFGTNEWTVFKRKKKLAYNRFAGNRGVATTKPEAKFKAAQCKLVHGKPRHSQSQGSVERANQDIEKKLASWMQDNNTTNWSNGIRFVQFMKNRALHSGIKQSPYKAMFGIEPRIGLMTSTLPRDVIEDIRDEDDLENALNKINMTDSTDTAETEPVASCSGEHQIITGGKQKAAESSSKTSEESPVEVEASQYDIEAGASTAEEPLIIPPNDKDIEVITNVNQQIMTSREAAHQNLKKQAIRMTLASDKIHVPVEIGDNVIIQIPDVDRAKANLRNIVGVVLQKDDQGFHKIGTKYGMLDKLYCMSELDKCKEKFLHEEDVPNTSLPLRTVAREIQTLLFTRTSSNHTAVYPRYTSSERDFRTKRGGILACGNIIDTC
ncbi:unnamed protein product [Danaus chrysippus]|uniref:(African queen) hypothetical protein n=1 Tax=Danaus chrysippus TaxID=151541 RepID=A0A8J2WAJ5_9NEOP|nr:unnamed protein product [Danaus chrysippus]